MKRLGFVSITSLAFLAFLAAAAPGVARAQTQVKGRVMVLVDTSGSMV